MQKKGSIASNPLHELPVAVSGRFHRRFRQRFFDDLLHQPRWHPVGTQVSQHPVLRPEGQREPEESVADEVSHRRCRLQFAAGLFKERPESLRSESVLLSVDEQERHVSFAVPEEEESRSAAERVGEIFSAILRRKSLRQGARFAYLDLG